MGHVYQKGDGWAISFIDENGTRIRRKVAPDKKTAQAILESYMGRFARQEHLGIIEDDAISFADFADEWLKKAVNKLRPNTRDKWTRLVRNHLKPFFSGALRAVTASKVGEYTAKRIEAGAAPNTINSELIVLKNIFVHAVDWKVHSRNPLRDVQGNPAKGAELLKPPPGRVRYLKVEEIDRLLAE